MQICEPYVSAANRISGVIMTSNGMELEILRLSEAWDYGFDIEKFEIVETDIAMEKSHFTCKSQGVKVILIALDTSTVRRRACLDTLILYHNNKIDTASKALQNETAAKKRLEEARDILNKEFAESST